MTNRLAIYFVAGQKRYGAPVIRGAPRAYGEGGNAELVSEAPYASCGCAAVWVFGHFQEGCEQLWGWNEKVRHTQSCRRSQV